MGKRWPFHKARSHLPRHNGKVAFAQHKTHPVGGTGMAGGDPHHLDHSLAAGGFFQPFLSHFQQFPAGIVGIVEDIHRPASCPAKTGFFTLIHRGIRRFKPLIPGFYRKVRAMRYGEGLLEEIRRRTDLVQLVGRRVKLVRKGRVMWGCPFHAEKSPASRWKMSAAPTNASAAARRRRLSLADRNRRPVFSGKRAEAGSGSGRRTFPPGPPTTKPASRKENRCTRLWTWRPAFMKASCGTRATARRRIISRGAGWMAPPPNNSAWVTPPPAARR